jgi:hypothetical protein
MSWSLARKVSAALVAILLCTGLLTAVFGYYKFEDVLSSLVRSRYSFVVFTIKKNIEDRLNLGFALRQLRQVQETIELEKVRDDQIMGIEIYDARGEVLFNTDRGGIGISVPAKWLEPLALPSSQPFSLMDDDMQLVGLPLVNTLGKVEGAVILRFPAAFVDRELGPLLSRVAVELLAALGLFSVIAMVASYVLLGSVGRRLRAMEQTLNTVLAEGGEAEPDLTDEGGFESRYAEFVAKTREAVDHIAESTQEVERLDRLA